MTLLRREKNHGCVQHVEVLLVVYWLAHGLSYSVVSRVFDVPKTTVFDIVHRMCEAILCLLEKVIHFPTQAQCAEVGNGFHRLANSPAFSHCVGAIDGCHILDIFVGYPGSVHDTRVLRNSPVFLRGCYPPAGHYIVGDGGYPCLREPLNLITPYREPLRGRVEACFNRHHARARSVVERAFGMMKARWRGIFFKALEVDHSFSPKVIAVCAVLHNICLTAGDILEPTEGEDPVPLPPQGPVQRDEHAGQHYRDRLAAHMSAPHQRPPHLNDHDYFLI
ncbi:hypothetical protein OYC64_010211 [Pagothenia borchgrevinki]